MQSWLSYWDAPNTSYVSDRHKQAHYDVLFAGIRPHLPGPDGVILDWGCGDAFAAGRIAEHCGTVLLFDAAETTRERLNVRYGSNHRIRVLDDSGLNAVPHSSVDLVVVNSVVQYLLIDEFDEALSLLHRLIRLGGALLVGDVISPGTGNSRHATTFLRFAWKRGFLLAAIGGLTRKFISPYRRLQHDLGLTAYTPIDMLHKLERHGFTADKLPHNIAVSQHRSSYIGRKLDGFGLTPSDHHAASAHERGPA